VYDWGSHHIDWILQLLGSTPSVVSATGHKRVWHDVTNHDQIRVRMTWPDGREAQFLCSDIAAVRPPKLYVQGTGGTIAGSYRPVRFERIDPAGGYQMQEAHHAEAPADLRLVRHQTRVGLVEGLLPLAPSNPYAFHRNLADHLLLGDPLAVSVASVRETVAVLEAATTSSAQGGRQLSPAPAAG
ncbi:MAG: Gfo/Idh/MocA family protein, partial [Pseudonocardiaceae bacterium]